MNKYFYILPRQIGKTTMAVSEFLRNPSQSLLICHNTHMADSLIKKINFDNIKDRKNIISVGSLSNYTNCDNTFKKIILDEYLFYTLKQRKEIYEILLPSLDINSEIIIYSTPSKIYNQILFNRIKKYKQQNKSIDEIIYEISKCPKLFIPLNDLNDIAELYYNFITEPNIKIIDVNSYKYISPIILSNHENRYGFNDMMIKTEIHGQYIN